MGTALKITDRSVLTAEVCRVHAIKKSTCIETGYCAIKTQPNSYTTRAFAVAQAVQSQNVYQSHALASGRTATGLPRHIPVWTFLAACQVTCVPANPKRALNTTTQFKIISSSLAPRRRRQCCACRSSPVPAAPSLPRRAPLPLGAARAPLHPPACHTQSSHHMKNIVRVFLQLSMCAWGRVGAIICSQ